MSTQENQQTNSKKPAKKKKRQATTGQKVLIFIAKWMFIFMCLIVSGIAGLIVGYSVIGEGSIAEVFDFRTWKHVYDLVFKI